MKDGAVTSLDEARRLADTTLDRYADLLGRGASSFVETTALKANHVYIFVYDQRFGGLDVIGGRADVRLHDSGGVSMFGSKAFAIPKGFDIRPRIDLPTARSRAWIAKDLEPPVAAAAGGGDRLVIWGDVEAKTRSPVHLAYEIGVERLDRKIAGKVYVDAMAGAVLAWRNDFHECSFDCGHAAAPEPVAAPLAVAAPLGAQPPVAGPLPPVVGKVVAWTNTGLKPYDPLVKIPVRNVLVSVVGHSSGYTDANGDFSIPHTGTDPVQVRVEFKGRHVADTVPRQGTKVAAQMQATPGTPVTIEILTQTAPDFDFSQATGYWGTDDVNEYLRAVIGGLPPRIDAITVYTNLTQTCNAHYTGNTINFYNRGGSCNMTCYSTVIYHEWGHGIDDAYGGISQTDGLSEGWGDLIATYRSGQPIIADNFYTNGNYIRTALNTYTYPAGGGVHQQGQTWMGFGWEVRENLRKSLGDAAGIARAEKIVLTSIGANARNQPDAVREVFIVDDNDSNLNNGTPNYTDLEKAAVNRKLPYPAKRSDNPGVYTTFGLGCPGSGLMPTTCVKRNDTGNNTNTQTLVNLTYAIEVSAPVDMTIDGFELYTSSRTGSTVSREARLYSMDTTGRPGTIERKAQMQIGGTLGWHKVTFSSPWPVQANSQFFLSWVNQQPGLTGSITAGTPSPYWRNDGVSGAWTGPYNTTAWAYRVSCVATGGAVPILGSTGFPEINNSFDVTLQAAAPGKPYVLLLGVSKTAWGVIPLPFELTPLGAAGCWLLASGELQGAFLTTATGTGSVTLPLPNDSNLVNAVFHNQILVVDAAANKLGIAFSNGGTAKIGKGP